MNLGIENARHRKENLKEYRKNEPGSSRRYMPGRLSLWQKVGSRICYKCHGAIKAISFIEDKEDIENILEHLEIWSGKKKPSPKANAPPVHANLD